MLAGWPRVSHRYGSSKNPNCVRLWLRILPAEFSSSRRRSLIMAISLLLLPAGRVGGRGMLFQPLPLRCIPRLVYPTNMAAFYTLSTFPSHVVLHLLSTFASLVTRYCPRS